MRFSLTTWNINSVRLRIDIVAKFLKSARPDVLCLQEQMHRRRISAEALQTPRLRHVALNGQKGYHGVAIVSNCRSRATDIVPSATRSIRVTSRFRSANRRSLQSR